MKRFCLILAAFSLALCACNEVENNEIAIEEVPGVYHLNIQAALTPQTKAVEFSSDGTSVTTMFEESDCVYVYNETKGAFARVASGNLIALHPSAITSNTSCTLAGELSFYVWDDGHNQWALVTDISENDTYALFYQLNNPDSRPSNNPYFDYVEQDGSSSSVSSFDFAEATGIKMRKDGDKLTLGESVTFTNLQSMFRLRLTFTKGGSTVTPADIVSLAIGTKNNTLVIDYSPTGSEKHSSIHSFSFLVPPVLTSDNDIYLALSFSYDDEHKASGDELILLFTDAEGNLYQGSKGVPSGGFENSKYYYGSMTLEWKSQKVKPQVTRTDGYADVEPDDNGCYSYSKSLSNPDPTQITISGNSNGYYFTFVKNAIVTLDGNGTAINEYQPFIYENPWTLTIVLASDYTIDCRKKSRAIYCENDDLKLKTDGDTPHRLTVLASNKTYRGLYGWNFDDYSIDPSVLAASGFTVVLESETEGPDDDSDGNPDYYTWVYLVSPNNS